MLVPASGPPDAANGGVRALFVSLNSPVVGADGLPVGPAQAAIALHAAGGASLLIRSSRTRALAWLRSDPAADDALGAAEAFAHAESLGFLFDEEQPLGDGIDRRGWPGWLVEAFFGEEPPPREDPAAALSKFRWALPVAPRAAAGPQLGGRP